MNFDSTTRVTYTIEPTADGGLELNVFIKHRKKLSSVSVPLDDDFFEELKEAQEFNAA